MVGLLDEGKKWLRDSVMRWIEDEYEFEVCNFNKSDLAEIKAVNKDFRTTTSLLVRAKSNSNSLPISPMTTFWPLWTLRW